MTPLMLIAITLGAPVLLLVVLRINAATVFLSLCLGSVLVQFVSKDARSFVMLFLASRAISDSLISLGLLLSPAIFTMVVMIHTVRGSIRMVLNLLPALTVGVLGLFLTEPLFSPGLRGSIDATSVWHDLQRGQTMIIGVSAIISLFFLWLQRSKHSGSHEGRHHRR